MKKIALILLVLAMALSMVACGNKNNDDVNNGNNDAVVDDGNNNENNEENVENGGEETPDAEDDAVVAVAPIDVLNTVWATYGEEEMFYAMGGDYDNLVDNAPGVFNHENAEYLQALLVFPADAMTYIDGAASLIHGMNANTFTAGVFHITDPANIQTVADLYKTSIANNQWMCGFPETLLIVSVDGDNLVCAFGNGEVVQNFKTKLITSYANATVIVEEPIL